MTPDLPDATSPRADRSPAPAARPAGVTPRRRRPALRALAAGAAGVALAGGLVACTPGADPDGPATAAPSATSSPSASPGPTASATATPVPDPAPAPTPTPAPAPSASPAAAPATPPPAAAPVHGATVWAVYVAVRDQSDDAAWQAAAARLEQLGYPAAEHEIACDLGAPEALDLDPQAMVRSVHFASAADAQGFVALYGGGVVGTAEVTTLCLD